MQIALKKTVSFAVVSQDGFHRLVDMLAENSKGKLILIEVQNNNEYAYFQRMPFGTSKLVTEYINL